jgi:hypothetical protein
MMLSAETETDEQEHLAPSISLRANDNSESVVKGARQPVQTDIGARIPKAE